MTLGAIDPLAPPPTDPDLSRALTEAALGRRLDALDRRLFAMQTPDWHYVGAAGEPALVTANGWAMVGGAGWEVRFWRDPFSVVHIGGGVFPNGAPPTGPLIFTLPPGFRPASHGVRSIAGTIDPIYATVGADGSVSAVAPAVGAIPAGHIVSLSSLAFYAGL